MSHWPYEEDREDGDTHDQGREAAVRARKWLRQQADESRSPFIRSLMGDLREIEQLAEPFYLGLDHDEDFSDCDDEGPF
ncbi:hypothetical protein UFOVP448_46 [uncultured Caudovirales phage]|uniref:Uncharacterized protein n=1 Tax=uncultured Caudovirales phage TaxID=2100421 RepID=A0A6J5M864_9CAUD|nr:hypothetical protein UFOVP448_46 [uncultured Caudovirales phage]